MFEGFRVSGRYIRCSTDGSIVVLRGVQSQSVPHRLVAET